jgi:hypothetical protein
MSPAIHNTGFQHHQLDYNYSITEIGSVQDCLLVTAHEHYVASVTMSYKLEVTKYCDIVTHEGKLMAALNTLSVQKGANGQRIIKGDNTDGSGILNCIRAKYLSMPQGPLKRAGSLKRMALQELLYMRCTRAAWRKCSSATEHDRVQKRSRANLRTSSMSKSLTTGKR